MVTDSEWRREYLYGGRDNLGDDLIPLSENDIRAIAAAHGGPSIGSTLAARLLKAEQGLRDLREHDAHLPSGCTYDDPDGFEVLAFRDARHVVVPAEDMTTVEEVTELNERLLEDLNTASALAEGWRNLAARAMRAVTEAWPSDRPYPPEAVDLVSALSTAFETIEEYEETIDGD